MDKPGRIESRAFERIASASRLVGLAEEILVATSKPDNPRSLECAIPDPPLEAVYRFTRTDKEIPTLTLQRGSEAEAYLLDPRDLPADFPAAHIADRIENRLPFLLLDVCTARLDRQEWVQQVDPNAFKREATVTGGVFDARYNIVQHGYLDAGQVLPYPYLTITYIGTSARRSHVGYDLDILAGKVTPIDQAVSGSELTHTKLVLSLLQGITRSSCESNVWQAETPRQVVERMAERKPRDLVAEIMDNPTMRPFVGISASGREVVCVADERGYELLGIARGPDETHIEEVFAYGDTLRHQVYRVTQDSIDWRTLVDRKEVMNSGMAQGELRNLLISWKMLVEDGAIQGPHATRRDLQPFDPELQAYCRQKAQEVAE